MGVLPSALLDEDPDLLATLMAVAIERGEAANG